ncbi:MAG: GTP-binding protein [Pseudomonadota bacterium]
MTTGSQGSELLPVSVITGFLGSGKTTLLAKLLKHPAVGQVALIINEFGEIGLDHDLIRTSDETVVELNSGCLCCTVQSDLATTLRGLFIRRAKGEVPSFSRVIIETTGLADPAPILHTLMTDRMLEHYFRLDGIITLVDAVTGGRTMEVQPEALKQAAVADRIVISKADLSEADALQALRTRLRALNPSAPILEAVQGDIDPSAILEAGLYDPSRKSLDVQRWLREEAYHADAHEDGHHHHGPHGHDVNRHDERIQAFCIRRQEPIGGAAMSFFLNLLTSQRGEDLLRVKGILNIAETPDTPMVIHGVQHLFHPPAVLDAWPSEDRDTRLVFITRDLPRSEIERLLDALTQPTGLDEAAAVLSSNPPREPEPEVL